MNKKELVCAGVGFLLLVVLVFMAIKFSDNSGTDLGNGSSDEYMEDIESGENTITTETYTINDTVNGARVSFEFAANYLGFKTQEETSGVGFVNPKNGANISVLLEYIDANEILNATMDSFNTDIYHDFEKMYSNRTEFMLGLPMQGIKCCILMMIRRVWKWLWC